MRQCDRGHSDGDKKASSSGDRLSRQADPPLCTWEGLSLSAVQVEVRLVVDRSVGSVGDTLRPSIAEPTHTARKPTNQASPGVHTCSDVPQPAWSGRCEPDAGGRPLAMPSEFHFLPREVGEFPREVVGRAGPMVRRDVLGRILCPSDRMFYFKSKKSARNKTKVLGLEPSFLQSC